MPFTSLTAAQKQPVQQLQQLQSTVRGIIESHLSCCGLKTRRASWLYFPQMHSVLQPLTNNKLPHLAKALQSLSNCRVALQCILAHCAVPGNKYADNLATEDAQTAQSGANVSYQEKATITKALMTQSQDKGGYNLFSGSDQVIMVRLRTARTRLKAHMHTKLEMVP